MNLEQIREVVDRALPLRFPKVDELRGAEKVAALEDHMLASALISGDLVEARHWLRRLQETLRDEWAHLEGWEVALKRPRDRATKAEIEEAKVKVSPALYAAGREARQLLDSVDDQITRFEREERVASRAYTMMSGG